MAGWPSNICRVTRRSSTRWSTSGVTGNITNCPISVLWISPNSATAPAKHCAACAAAPDSSKASGTKRSFPCNYIMQSSISAFAFSLNPYVGCAIGDNGGCPFCYVRALPVARQVKGEWGKWVIAKLNLPDLLECELRSLAHRGQLAHTTVFMSSATDPYQGIERRLQITRSALATLAK